MCETKWKKISIRLLTAVILVVQCIGIHIGTFSWNGFSSKETMAAAYWDSYTALTTSSSGMALSAGNYKVTSNLTISNSAAGGNGITISSGVTVTIYIPSGYTLTVSGGNGSGTIGGGAGIYLPSNSNLIIRGGGTLVAIGGNGGNAGSGGNGDRAYSNGTFLYSSTQSGSRSYGGAGGGAAGSGIGSSGASGGGNTTSYASNNTSAVTSTTNSLGKNGVSGNGGMNGGSMGILYIMDSITVSATAGTKGSVGLGGQSGANSAWVVTGKTVGLGGTAGGGGGGRGGNSANIGGAGGGGGSGGTGGTGGSYYLSSSLVAYAPAAGCGGGGGGGGTGGTVNSGITTWYNYNSPTTTVTKPSVCTDIRTWGAAGTTTSESTLAGGAGGASNSGSAGGGGGGTGGNRGIGGSGGTVFKASTATITYAIGGGTTSNGDGGGAAVSTAPYTITYDANGGSLASVPSTESKFTGITNYITNQIPTKTGYSFLGWNTSNTATTANYVSGSSYSANANLKLYAIWMANTYNITYSLGSGGMAGANAPTTGSYDTVFYVSAPSKAGYTFEGWTVTSGLVSSTAKYGSSSLAATSVSSNTVRCKNGATGNVYFINLTTAPSGGVTLTANWTANTYTITLHNEPSDNGVMTLAYGSSVPASVSVPTREGYEFLGYFAGEDGSGLQYYSSTGSRMYTGTWTTAANGTLYAKWIMKRLVYFDRQGGSGGTASIYQIAESAAMPHISSPAPPVSSEGAVFRGYYTRPNGSGTKYYNADGSSAHAFDFAEGSNTLYAFWAYTLNLNNQGVAGGSESLVYGQLLPESVVIPLRHNYEFEGYYGAINGGGEKYYDAAGVRVYSHVWDKNTSLTIYALWKKGKNTFTVDLNGGSWKTAKDQFAMAALTSAGGLENYSGVKITIPEPGYPDPGDPDKQAYTFVKWELTGAGTFANRVYTYDIGERATLKALWGPAPVTELKKTGEVAESVLGKDQAASDLGAAYKKLVEDETRGITQEEMLKATEIKMTLSVVDSNSSAVGATNIKSAAQGEVAQFYDISVEKTVVETIGEQIEETSTKLVEIPATVQVRIPLIGELAGKTGYAIYRYHDGIAERLSVDDKAEEYFKYSARTYSTGEEMADELLIYTRKFSTYAVIINETYIQGHGAEELVRAANNGSDLDVQAKIKEDSDVIYKIDISWGAMTFEYSTGNQWNPETHSYDGEVMNDWMAEGFANGNNKIVTANHSNASVIVDFNVLSNIDGVDMEIKQENASDAAPATDMALSKVPGEGAAAPELITYLWLVGTPQALPDGEDNSQTIWGSTVDKRYRKAGIITITIRVDEDDTELTPRGR